MPFLNLNTFPALFIVSGMAFQRMLPRKAKEFMPKDIVLVGGICSVFLMTDFHDLMIYISLSLISVNFSCGLLFHF